MAANRNLRVLLLALLIATAAAVVVYQLVVSRLTPPPAVVEVTPESGEPVVIGARALAAGTTLTASDIRIVYINPTARGERALTESSQAIGRVTLLDIPEGDQILAGSIGDTAPLAPANTFAREVPIGMRAVTISIEETVGVGGLVQPGDRVDVIAGLSLDRPLSAAPAEESASPDGTDTGEMSEIPVAELLVQDVQVLAIGQALQSNIAPAPTVAAGQTPAAVEAAGPITRPEATSVTLLVDPAQALRLLLAVQGDSIFRLLLRAPGDSTVTELPPAFITDGVVNMPPFELVGANLPIGGLTITSSRFEQRSVPAGGVLDFEVTVRNVSDLVIAAGGGADPGYVYTGNESWEEVAGDAQPGSFSLALTSDTVEQVTFPWRWDLGQDLEPGESVTFTGGVQVPNRSGLQRWWFGIMSEPGTVVEDGVGLTEVTVEPVAAVVVLSPDVDLRAAPWPDAAVVDTAVRGTTADVLEYGDGWFLIRSGDSEGWVPEGFVVNSVLPAAEAIATAPADATPEAQGESP